MKMTENKLDGFMSRALAQAQAAYEVAEVPVGALVMAPDGETVLAETHNAPVSSHDPSAHAEIRALRQAAAKLGNYRLTGCTLVVTLEPCAMCAGAISHARIGHLVYGASDTKGGAVQNGVRFFDQPTCHHRPDVTAGIRVEEAARLLKNFFQARRQGR